jgi:hypothetical protein
VDEALAVGDTEFQQRCYTHLRRHLSSTAKLFVTHDLSTLATMTDRVLVLDEGRLVFDGATPDALRFYTDLTRRGTKVTLTPVAPAGHHPALLPYEQDIGLDAARHDKAAALRPVPPEATNADGAFAITDTAFLTDGYAGVAVAPGDCVTVLLRVSSTEPHPAPGLITLSVTDRKGLVVVSQNSAACLSVRPGTI